MLPLPVILESQDDMRVVDGATIEPRIRINRPDDENTRCRVSSARGQPKDFSQLTQPPIIPSTSNAISFQPGHTEPFVRRLWKCGARQSRSFENIRDAEFSCSSFNDVTTPGESVGDLVRCALILDTASKTISDAQPLLDLAQHQDAAVR